MKLFALFISFLMFFSCDQGTIPDVNDGPTGDPFDGPTGDPFGGGSGFDVSGQLTISVPAANIVGSKSYQDNGTTIDYAYAVNTTMLNNGDNNRLSPIGADGSFSMELTKGDAWVLLFLDSTQHGPAMIKGIFKADVSGSGISLDTIKTSSDSGDGTDLGSMELDPDTQETNLDTTKLSGFLSDVGLSTHGAETYGALDDQMLKFINPDIDDDGIIDILETDLDEPIPEFAFQQWFTYDYGDATDMENTLADLKAGSLPSMNLQPTFLSMSSNLWSYGPAGLGDAEQAAYNKSYYEARPKFIFEVRDPNDPNTVLYSTGTLTMKNKNDFDLGFQVESLAPDVNGKIPEGTYIYKTLAVNDDPVNDLIFCNVKTLDDVDNPENFVVPFPQFNTDGNDNIISVTFHWKIYRGGAFVDATSEEVSLVAGNGVAQVDWESALPSEPDTKIQSSAAFYPGGQGANWATTVVVDNIDLNSTTTGVMFGDTIIAPKLSNMISASIGFDTVVGLDIYFKIAAPNIP